LIKRLWSFTVFGNISFNELRSYRPKLNESIMISFASDGQSSFLRIKVVKV
jgi:hypothetical protein